MAVTIAIGRSNAVIRGMAKHPELFFIIFTIVVTVLSNYGNSFKSKPLVLPAQTPLPLFQTGYPVLDLHLGDLYPLVELLHDEDFVFVMYYAPWCARSKAVTSQFLRAAEFMEGQVRFIAVNCWYPEGMCRKQYKFLLFPVFFAYHDHVDGYRFMGIHRAEHMVKFLEDLLHPLTLLKNPNQVQDFLTEYDSIVVGYFNFSDSPQPPGYKQFFYSSMRAVEHDPYQPVKFCLITDYILANQFGLTNSSDIVFLRLNEEKLKYPFPDNITSSNIVKWVFANRNMLPVRWLVPHGMKSLLLSREINKGPAIIMFHRATPLSKASQTFAVLKDLALNYNSCLDDELSRGTIEQWQALSAQNLIQHTNLIRTCRNRQRSGSMPSFKCCMSFTLERKHGAVELSLSVCEICRYKSQSQFQSQRCSISLCSFNKELVIFQNNSLLPPDLCHCSTDSYDITSHTSVCCRKCNKTEPLSKVLTIPVSADVFSQGQERRPTDRYVLEGLENLPRRLCDRLKFQKNQGSFPSTVVPDFNVNLSLNNFIGAGCRQNRTLNFITLDSHSHWMFAESLGLDVSTAHLSPVVVAFDKENEEHYVLKEKFTKLNTATFILEFSHGRLKRDLRSVLSAQQAPTTEKEKLSVTELTTDTFLNIVLQPKDVVLLVYTDWCGFCISISHIFLHLAHYFHTSSDITFARINGERNDLPWEFSMDSYPAVIFFPALRKADSIVFPDLVTPSLPNLIRFVLQHSTFVTRLHLAADVCSSNCIRENLDHARQAYLTLRTKLQHFNMRVMATHSLEPVSDLAAEDSNKQNLWKLSAYKSEIKTFLRKRILELENELQDVKKLLDFLEKSNGKHLAKEKLEDLFLENSEGKTMHQNIQKR